MTMDAADTLRRQGGKIQLRCKRSTLLHLLMIAVFVLVAYANTFEAPFVLDDEPSIVNNGLIKDLDNFLASGSTHNPRRFIGYLTFALNYKFGGLDVRGYHIFNISLHIANALLVYALILLTFRTPLLSRSSLTPDAGMIAFFTGLLFAVHPVQTQAVTYIVQRLASLAALFMLVSLVLYIRSRLRQEGELQSRSALILYVFSLAAAVLAMKTKEIAFTLPVIVTVYELFFFSGNFRKRLIVLAPMLLTLAIIPLSLLDMPQSLSEALSDVRQVTKLQTHMSRWDYLITQFVVITKYIGLLVLPVNQNLDPDQQVFGSFLNPAVLASLLFLASILAAAVYLFVRSREGRPELRLASFGVLWFFAALSVESSIIPIADVMFEHRLYMPSAGFFLAGISGIMLLRDRLRQKQAKAAEAILPLLLITSFILTGATFVRNDTWRDDIGLWEDTVRKSPEKARPRYNLGVLYEKRGRLDDAMREYLTSIRLDPLFPLPYNNLGILYGRQGRYEEAISTIQAVFRLEPGDATAHTNLGIVYARQGKREEAVREFENALRLNPNDAEAHYNLGIAWEQLGRLEEAAQEYSAAIKAKPEYLDAYNNLGTLFAKRGDLDRAIAAFEAALKVDPGDPYIRRNLANAYRLRNFRL